MANYRTHATLNLAIGLPSLLVGAACMGIALPLLWTFTTVYVYGTLFAHPDMDLAYQNKFLSVRGILGLPFRSYARFFSHRGLSHSVLFGTLTRVIWLGIHVIAVLYLIYRISPTDRAFTGFLKRHQGLFLAGLCGLMAADWCHLIIDKIWSMKRH